LHNKNDNNIIIEQALFKHKTKPVYLLADAYRGKEMKQCIQDFLHASNRNYNRPFQYNDTTFQFGGASDLIAFTGHNGLMDFSVDLRYKSDVINAIDAVVLACYSKRFFSPEFQKSGANPLIWSTHLMAPEAYILHAILDAWINGKENHEIRDAAAQTYRHYQKCGLQAARKHLCKSSKLSPSFNFNL
jgi:hypothetical protein